MCEMKMVLFLTAMFVVNAFAQTGAGGTRDQVWLIPFGSEGNTITLSVDNGSSIDVKNVTVTLTNIPSWLGFKSSTAILKSIAARGTGDAEFTFSVDKKAPVGIDTTLTAAINTANGQSWTKSLTVSVEPPKVYKLYSNFPNPFNPSTRIAFELPKASHVTLIIYDVLGREVTEMTDRNYPAGYHEITWDGLNGEGEQVSSGVYFYRIATPNWTAAKKMLLLK